MESNKTNYCIPKLPRSITKILLNMRAMHFLTSHRGACLMPVDLTKLPGRKAKPPSPLCRTSMTKCFTIGNARVSMVTFPRKKGQNPGRNPTPKRSPSLILCSAISRSSICTDLCINSPTASVRLRVSVHV